MPKSVISDNLSTKIQISMNGYNVRVSGSAGMQHPNLRGFKWLRSASAAGSRCVVVPDHCHHPDESEGELAVPRWGCHDLRIGLDPTPPHPI